MSDLLHILQHSLGVDQFGRGEQYRNHFTTGDGSVDHPICMEAVERGLMHRHATSDLTRGSDLFIVTAAGKAWVAENSPKPDRKQRAAGRESSMNKQASFFIVWNPEGMRPPKYRHDELYMAKAEASRLALENPLQEFFVMEARLVARVFEPVDIEEFEPAEEVPF